MTKMATMPIYEPVRDKTNKLEQNIDFYVLVFYDRMGNMLQIGA